MLRRELNKSKAGTDLQSDYYLFNRFFNALLLADGQNRTIYTFILKDQVAIKASTRHDDHAIPSPTEGGELV